MVSVDQPTDQGVQQDDEDSPQSIHEEKQTRSTGDLLRQIQEGILENVEEEQTCQAQCSIQLSLVQVLQGIDHDLVSRPTTVDICRADTHQCRNLSDSNVEGRSSNIRAD